jgi:hypothetical protein
MADSFSNIFSYIFREWQVGVLLKEAYGLCTYRTNYTLHLLLKLRERFNIKLNTTFESQVRLYGTLNYLFPYSAPMW